MRAEVVDGMPYQIPAPTFRAVDAQTGDVALDYDQLREENTALKRRVTQLETQLAQARSERDTAKAQGGVL